MHRTFSWLLPSFGAFFTMVVFLNLFWEQDSFLSSPEVCRYLDDGAKIHRDNGIALNDSFTLAPISWQWVNVKWGTCLLVYILYSWGGFSSVVLYFHGMLAATLFILYRSLVRSGAGMFTVVSFMTVIYGLFHYKFLLHAHLFSYLFLAGLVGTFRMRSSPSLMDWLFLPVIFFFWGNLDNGWVCGAIFLGVSLFGRWIDTPTETAVKRKSQEDSVSAPAPGEPALEPVQPRAAAHRQIADPNPEAETGEVGILTEQPSDHQEETPVDVPERPELKQIRLWFRLVLVCLVCALLNPVLFLFNLSNISVYFDQLLQPTWYVHETPDFSGPSAPALVILFVLICMLLSRFVTDRPLTSFESGLTTLFFTELALKGQEQAWLLLIVACVPLAQDIDALVQRFLRVLPVFACSEEILAKWQSLAGGDFIWSLALCGLLGFAWDNQPRLTAELKPNADVLSPPCVAFIKAHADHFKRCFTSPETGSTLIWYVPDAKVTLDERTEFVKPPFFQAIAQTLELAANWTHTIHYGKFNSAVIYTKYPVITGLEEIPGWTLVYSDPNVCVFFNNPDAEKTPAENISIVAVPANHSTAGTTQAFTAAVKTTTAPAPPKKTPTPAPRTHHATNK